MRFVSILAEVFCVVLTFSTMSFAQGDIRSATGLPIPIGAPAIWGQVNIEGLQQGERLPSVFVTLMFNGAQMGRSQVNDRGYYYFLTDRRDGAELVVEVDGEVVGRNILTAAGGTRVDFTVNSAAGSRRNGKNNEVISVKDFYERSSDNEKLFDKASAAAKNKKTDEAIKLYEQITTSDPKDFVTWTELASLYFGQKKYSNAQTAYEKAIELKPDFMLALLNIGKLFYAQKRFDRGIPYFFNAVRSDPNSADAFEYLGEGYLQTKQGSKAVVALNEALRLDPKGKAEVHLRLAALYNAAGAKDRAANEYKLFLEKKPDFPEKAKLQKYIDENSK